MSVNAWVRTGGIPTGPDVDNIIAKYPIQVMVPGFVIPYDDITKVIGQIKGSSRYASIVGAWRKRLYEQYNVFIGVSRGAGFQVLDGSGRVETASTRVKHSVKRVVKAGRLARTTDVINLTPAEQRMKTHLENLAGSIETLAATARKKLSYEIKSIAKDRG